MLLCAVLLPFCPESLMAFTLSEICFQSDLITYNNGSVGRLYAQTAGVYGSCPNRSFSTQQKYN
jgi:hypothetical protein